MLARLFRFRDEVVILWHAFGSPLTPLYLKVIAGLTVLYVLNPADILPDVIPLLGLVDDVLLVGFMVSWIVCRLPQYVPAQTKGNEKTIDGTARRL